MSKKYHNFAMTILANNNIQICQNSWVTIMVVMAQRKIMSVKFDSKKN